VTGHKPLAQRRHALAVNRAGFTFCQTTAVGERAGMAYCRVLPLNKQARKTNHKNQKYYL
jgi:hypothetical protein